MVSLGMILILVFLFAMAIVIWDFEQKWDEMYDSTNWDLTDED